MEPRQIQELLNANGFPCGAADGIIGQRTRAATARFQQATNIGSWLTVDGIPGPRTQQALAELPWLSDHFAVDEVACKHCGLAYIRRELLRALEKLRDVIGPIPLESAYRCAHHNRSVGGASRSMHLHGYAADTRITTHVTELVPLQLFSGIGDRLGIVKHIDLRHLSPENETPTASLATPIRWHY